MIGNIHDQHGGNNAGETCLRFLETQPTLRVSKIQGARSDGKRMITKTHTMALHYSIESIRWVHGTGNKPDSI